MPEKPLKRARLCLIAILIVTFSMVGGGCSRAADRLKGIRNTCESCQNQ